jgi:hypothetical protein
VSHWPADWTAAVCVPPVHRLRTPYEALPHATQSGVCRARVEPAGDVVDVTIARFRSELEMQVDLVNEGFTWYAFAWHHGQLLAYATHSSETTNWSPVLEPLEKYGFNIYAGPGP